MSYELLNTILLIIHFIIAIALIVVVLLQADKGVGLSGAFGGGASQTIFGTGDGLSYLGKITTVFAILFMITSFSIYFISTKQNKTIKPRIQTNSAPIQAPVVPTTPPVGTSGM